MPNYSNGGATGTNIDIALGNGDGTFKAVVSFVTGLAPKSVDSGDLNGDGYVDLVVTNYGAASFGVLLGNGNGTFKAQTTFITLGNPSTIELVDVTRDGILDAVEQDWAGKLNVFVGNGDGTFKAKVSYTNTGANPFQIGDFNGDGLYDVLSANQNLATVTLLAGNGDGTFKAGVSTTATGTTLGDIKVNDINEDGYLDFVTTSVGSSVLSVGLGAGNGTFTVSTIQTADGPRGAELVDADGDGYLDILTVDQTTDTISTYLGNGDGTFKGRITSASGLGNPWYASAADFDKNGTLDLLVGSYDVNPSFGVLFGDAREVGTATHISLISQADAREALDTLTSQLDRITKELGAIGSFQSRLGIAANTLSVSRENYLEAASRIMDVDVAEESANLISSQVRQQATAAVLAQANQQPALVLRLLS